MDFNYISRIIFVFFFLSCSGEAFIVDSRIEPYIQNIESELNQRGITFSKSFHAEISQGLLESKGAYGISRGQSIYIDQDTFNSLEDRGYHLRLEALIAHEVGHNVFDLRHSDSFSRNNKLDIMFIGSWQFVTEDNIEDMYDNLANLIR